MRVLENGVYRDMAPEEISTTEAADREYWQNVPYGVAVAAEIHKRYTVDDEMGLHRQKDKKPEEYAEYFAYCEECKAFVKAKKMEVNE